MFYMLNSLIDSIVRPMRTINFWIVTYVPGMKRVPSLSVPMRWALMAFMLLLFTYIAALIDYWIHGDELTKRPWLVWLGFFMFVIVIPVVVYWLAYFGSLKEQSRYPELDRLWQAALDACEHNGISVEQVPLFCVLGTQSSEEAGMLVNASRLPVQVQVNESNADISIFASHDGIYMFLQGCSCLSGVGSAPAQPVASEGPSEVGTSSSVAGTMVFGGSQMPGSPMGAGGGSDEKTATLAGAGLSPGMQGQAPASSEARGTLPGGPNFAQNIAARPPLGGPPAGGGQPISSQPAGGTILLPTDGPMNFAPEESAPVTRTLDPNEAMAREAKLRHMCNLVRDSRGSLCPINGLLSILTVDLIENACGAMQDAAQADYRVLREELLVRCSNHVLVTGFEEDDGFLEFVKRVGEPLAAENRFGKGCDSIWSFPGSDRLKAVGAHAVGAFEDWIFMLFRKENALTHPTNYRLYMLLCRVRSVFSENLQKILAAGFGLEDNADPDLADTQFLFGGCYFAAAGERPETQAFLKGVFKKMSEREGQLDWSPEAIQRDASHRITANFLALTGMCAILAIVIMLLMESNLLPSLLKE